MKEQLIIGGCCLLIYLRYKKREFLSSPPGKVFLVGAGPGAVDLITVRGLNLLKSADIVLNDRLVHPNLLQYCKDTADIINVGKGSEKDRFSQKDLEKELILAAKRVGKDGIVVRLKGGDPYVFGLGGSEALALQQAGISWEYVPGLSSASALPGLSLNTPLTHKGTSSGFLVLSGHLVPTMVNEWGQLPRVEQPSITLVVLMCAKNLKSISQFLLNELGWSPNLPCALVNSGSMESEKSILSNLLDLSSDADQAGLDEAPLMLIVGNVCGILMSEAERVSKRKQLKNDNTSGQIWGVPRSPIKKETEWWVFGYGSLVWRPSDDLPYVQAEDGYVKGFVRRFWQESPDHRGTPDSPGRVVTMLEHKEIKLLDTTFVENDEPVFGRVYQVHPSKIDETKDRLLVREKAGYEERIVQVHLKNGSMIKASVFIAGPHNIHFIGPESIQDIAMKISTSAGPSGMNIEYFHQLFHALQQMKVNWPNMDTVDKHLHDIKNAIEKIKS